MKTIFLATLLAALPAFAQDAPKNACPLDFQRTKLRITRPDARLTLRYKNTSAKQIVGAKFTLEFIDSTGDHSEYPEDFGDSSRTKPGETIMFDGTWTLFIGDEAAPKFRVYVKKIAFADGTTWADDGTGKCSFTGKSY